MKQKKKFRNVDNNLVYFLPMSLCQFITELKKLNTRKKC